MTRTRVFFAELAIFGLGAMLLVATQTSSLHAGQEAIIPLSHLLTPSHLVAVVEVKEVTQVDVSTGRGQLTSVYVAQAVVEQHIKPDIFPAPGGGPARGPGALHPGRRDGIAA